MGRNKLTFKYIKEQIEEKGHILLSKKYINAHSKLKIKCGKGHIYKIQWSNFQQGKRCPICSFKHNGRKRTLTYEFVKLKIEREGYKLLSNKYVNNYTKLKLQCPKGHIYKAPWSSFKKGHRCPICSVLKENNPYWKGGEKITWFDTYASKIDFCEEVRRDPNNKKLLQVKCTNSDCKKWFTPTKSQIYNRMHTINGKINGSNRFYCSEECKHSCSLYGQKKYPKGFKPDHSRSEQYDWANMVKDRDNYECQKCGSKNNLVAHHIEGIYENPLMSADIDVGITLCKICHKKIHKEKGCKYYDLRRNNLCKEV